MKNSFKWCFFLLMTLSLVIPTVLPYQKTAILLVCTTLATYLFFIGYSKIDQRILVMSLLYVVAGISWSVYGYLLGNAGALSVLTVMVAYPLILPLIAICLKNEDLPSLENLFINISWILATFDLLYIALSILAPENTFAIFVEDLFKNDAVIDDGLDYFKFTLPNIASCIFLVPFIFCKFYYEIAPKKYGLFALLFLMIIIVVLSGRRALFVSPILGVTFAFLLTAYSKTHVTSKPGQRKWRFLKASLLATPIVLFLAFFSGFEFYIQSIISILDFKTNASNIERVIQYNALVEGISNSPLFGSGAGAAASYSRSSEQPWAYELSYVAFIFHYGLLGFIFYASGILTILWVLIQSVHAKGRKSFEFYFLAGFISLIIANATNPYIAKFDYMWLIFIPYGIINNILVRKPTEYLSKASRG